MVKVTPQPSGLSMKTLVNLYTLEDDHFEDQAIAIKKLFYKYKARIIVLDANGLNNWPLLFVKVRANSLNCGKAKSKRYANPQLD